MEYDRFDLRTVNWLSSHYPFKKVKPVWNEEMHTWQTIIPGEGILMVHTLDPVATALTGGDVAVDIRMYAEDMKPGDAPLWVGTLAAILKITEQFITVTGWFSDGLWGAKEIALDRDLYFDVAFPNGHPYAAQLSLLLDKALNEHEYSVQRSIYFKQGHPFWR